VPVSNLARFFVLFFFLATSLAPAAQVPLSDEDRVLLEKIEKDSIQYFIRYADRDTGLVQDSSQPGSPASIAATGFGLASLAIAQSRGWISYRKAYDQIRKTLLALKTRAHHERGFFYHFLDMKTGKRVWRSEASSIDTALLLAGALLAAQYFRGTDLPRLAQELYERVDWKWMMNGTRLVCHGWKPESGFLPYYWDSYSELMILQALAIGSSTHPIPPESWEVWDRLEDEYNGKRIVFCTSGSLFTYQFAQAFIDFRELSDGGINYFDNSAKATTANWEYSVSFREQHKGYSESSWGLSASLGPGGYKAYGAKPGLGLHDGTVAPYASIASLVFTPELSLRTIKFFYENYQDTLYGPHGFKDAFNLDKKWWAREYLGIDQGISVMMLENFLSEGSVWQKFMKLPAIQKWIEVCKLRAPETRLAAKVQPELIPSEGIVAPSGSRSLQ
jgi:hypothetical protein